MPIPVFYTPCKQPVMYFYGGCKYIQVACTGISEGTDLVIITMPGGWAAPSLKEIKFQGNVKIKTGEIGIIKETQEIIRSYGQEPEPRGQAYPGPAHIIK